MTTAGALYVSATLENAGYELQWLVHRGSVTELKSQITPMFTELLQNIEYQWESIRHNFVDAQLG